MGNRIRRWREAAMRRRDERDVRVHPDTGSLPSHHSHRRPVHGGRGALGQIDAELAPTEAAAAGPVYAPGTVRWARAQIHRNLGEAADLHTKAMECLELEREVLARNVDLHAFLQAGSAAEFTPRTHEAPATAAVDEGQAPAQAPAKGTVGECYTCGSWAGTRWQFNTVAQRLAPTCPTCASTEPATGEEAARAQQTAAAADDTQPLTLLGRQRAKTGPAPQRPTASWWDRPQVLVNGDIDDTLNELAALDGAR